METIYKFYSKHKRSILAIFGILMISGALLSLYWSNSSSAISKENAKANKSIERMKAKGLLGGSSSSNIQKSNPKSLMSSYMEKKDEQNRILLIIVIVVGTIALLISFFSKKEENTISAK